MRDDLQPTNASLSRRLLSKIADERYEDVLAHLHEDLRRATSGEAPEQGSQF